MQKKLCHRLLIRSFWKIFPQFSKTFFIFFLIMHILFCLKNQKNMLQREIKSWTFKAYLLTANISSWFLLIESLKITCARSYVWFLNFYWIVLCDVLPKLSKITVSCPKSIITKMNINFEFLKVSKMTSLKIYISPVTEKLETSNLHSR